jgi:cell division protein ZapA (FtsZ GTPase activity inhibitor)
VAARRSVAVRIRGKEFRILTDGDEESLQRVAALVDSTMVRVERHTGAVDSLDVAMLAALNLARELLDLRASGPATGVDADRLRSLVEQAESALVA